MDFIDESPVKRRRTERSFVASQSQDSNDEETVATVPIDKYETIPTLPVDRRIPQTPSPVQSQDDENDTLATIPFTIKETPVLHRNWSQMQSSYMTQPTQIITEMRSSSPDPPRPVVQVAASSPAAASPKAPVRPGIGMIASRMAPPGTQFRNPRTVTAPVSRPTPTSKFEPIQIDSDDDGPVYVADSDDEDQRYNRDIKPTVIKSSKVLSAPSSLQGSFGSSFLDQFRHKPGKNGSAQASFASGSSTSQTSDVSANAYGSVSRPPRPVPKQKAPSKANWIPNITLEQIEDYQMRQRVQRMHDILPLHSVAACYQALIIKKGNQNDAMEYLAAKEDLPPEDPIVLSDEDELMSQEPTQPRRITVKQKVQTKKTIQEKYGQSAGSRSTQKPPAHSPVAPPKPKRKLVQGRRDRSPVPRSVTPISEDSEESEVEDESQDTRKSTVLLDFLNSCSVEELVDLAQTTPDKAELVLSHRPFKSGNEVRSVMQDPPSKAGAKRKARPVQIGEKIWNDSQSMWTGFRTVDQLVQLCQKMGEPIATAMEKWGINVFGGSTKGELEIVSLDETKSDTTVKDSGIGSSPQSNGDFVDEDAKIKTSKREFESFFPQPGMLSSDAQLKDYQVFGVNWLSLLFKHRLSCILADDMGLGKTCQVISFLAHLKETGIEGPHLIVVPSSVLENWFREFDRFCPNINVVAYHASKALREEDRESIMEDMPDVIVTTYAIARKPEDRRFFSLIKPKCCIFDEGHMLKNPGTDQYKQLMRISCEFRLLLTGTPLQNNLGELIALLGFMMPDMFKEHQEELQAIFGIKATTSDKDDQNKRLLSAQRIERAKSMMTPFILRRKKQQVLKDIPAKHRSVHYCDMSERQAALYDELKQNYQDLLRRRANGERVKADENANVMMSMRKAAIHPFLFRRLFTDETLREISTACLAEEEFRNSNPDLVFEDLEWASDMEMQKWCAKYESVQRFLLPGEPWMDSGKVAALCELLRKYVAAGDRTLVFSQFVMVLDVLEEVMETLGMRFSRLDGSLNVDLRQETIDEFYKDESIPVFLLSTRAGGAGINLACANRVIIFDSSFNPQDDVQAENRAHRVGQTREVEVVRLVTRGTVEEQIHALGVTKLALDDKVAGADTGAGVGAVDPPMMNGGGDDEPGSATAVKKMDMAGRKEVERMLAEELAG